MLYAVNTGGGHWHTNRSASTHMCNADVRIRERSPDGEILFLIPGGIAQLERFLAEDVCLTADPGVASSIPAWSHTISMVILLPCAE